MGEVPGRVQGPKLVFCRDHNVLLYPKSVLWSKPFKRNGTGFGSDWTEEEATESDTADKAAFPKGYKSEF